MKRIVFSVYISLALTVASFLFYICPGPPLFLDYEQMNNLLLAVFGAGASIFFVELIEYVGKCNDLEGKLLQRMEKLISSLASLKEFTCESIGGLTSDKVFELLVKYFNEEQFNKSFSSLFPLQHTARNELIQIIEHCEEADCESFANDETSSFRRLLDRSRRNIVQVYDSYRFCFDKSASIKIPVVEILDDLSYLPLRTFWRGRPIKLTNVRKTQLVDQLKTQIDSEFDELENIARICRLFANGEAGYSDLLEAFRCCEEKWKESITTSYGFVDYKSENKYARILFDSASEFACYSRASLAEHYRGAPWW